MRKFIPFLMVFAALSFIKASAQNAPVTTAPDIISNATVIVVPVSISDFNDVGSCNLRMLYDPAVVTATAITLATGIPGTINFNVSTPGLIEWGWFTWPALNLADDAVIFNISFTKSAPSGTTVLTWDDGFDYYCQWNDENYLPLNDQPTIDYYNNGSITIPDAPKTIAPDTLALANTTVDIPIKVIGFYNVGAISLTLLFDPAVLTYQTYENNSGFPGLQVNNPSSGVITIGGYSPSSGISLPDYAELVTIGFEFLGGYTDLSWFDDGTSCEYADYPEYNPYNDLPTSAFYINGSVSELLFRELNIKLFLEGLYNSSNGNMNKAQDYVGGNFEDKFPGTVADQITVELYEVGNYSGGPVYSAASTNLNQDGTASISIPSTINDEYFVTVKTRNHIETVSSISQDFGGGHVTYDFTTSAGQAFGSNQVELDSGVFGIYAGDVDQNGVINVTDRTILNIDLSNVVIGYVVADLDGNGTVNVTDRTKLNVNIFNVISKQTP
jgi:hypothetical protein